MGSMQAIATVCAKLGVTLILGLPLWGVAFDLTQTQSLSVLVVAFVCFGVRLGLRRFVFFSAPGVTVIMIGFGLAKLCGYPVLGSSCAAGGGVMLVGGLM